jgi:H+/Cl- antiporter ClcA
MLARIATALFGGLLGGLVGGAVVLGITVVLKAMFSFVAGESLVEVIVIPLLGLALTTLFLEVIGRSGGIAGWRTFPTGTVRADITGEVVDSAGEEERFRWRLAPLRTLAIFASVGSGASMGTEAPAAFLGVAVGAFVGDHGRRWRRLLRPAALAAGAAGVSAVMGVAAVGTLYMLEIGRRHKAPWSAERVIAALLGGVLGWGINVVSGVALIRLIVPKYPPVDLFQAAKTALFIGAIAGLITAIAGSLIYSAKKLRLAPLVRLAIGGLALALITVVTAVVAVPNAAVGPGGNAILWAENTGPLPLALLGIALLRAAATTSAVAAGGCGGIFVPFLAIGDLAGRAFAPSLDIGTDLAGAAGAAAGIAGGYRLPLTAIAMSLSIGGPRQATLTCLATIAIASAVGALTAAAVGKVTKLPYLWKRQPRP